MDRVQDSPFLPHVFFQCSALPKELLLSKAAEWRDLIDARGREPEFVAERYMQVCWVLEEAGYELTESRVTIAIGKKKKEGASGRTVQKYYQAVKSFSKWLAKPSQVPRLLPFDPLADLKAPSPKGDPRHVRTTFWPVFGQLLTTAEKSTYRYQGIAGTDRAELYHAAACTGLREGTLKVVEVSQFHLDATPAYVHIRADQTKDRQELVVPIQADSAARLARYLSGKMPHTRAFRTPKGDTDFVRMLKKDLAEAGIPYCRRVKLPNGKYKREDVLDFHSFRHMFGSWCAAGNVPLTTTQSWMGHSDPSLTSKHYVHVIPADQAAALLKLPPLPGVKRAS